MLCAYSQHLCYTCSRTNLKGNTMQTQDQTLARIAELHAKLGLEDGDYDENGANLRNSFNRDPAQADLWRELEALEKSII
jgi:ribosome assembly protein YihI (activator of Der GTPase)